PLSLMALRAKSINSSARVGSAWSPAQIAATPLQPGMSRKARTIAPESWPLFAPRGTFKSTTGREGTLASPDPCTHMQTPQSSPPPSIKIQGCAFSYSEAVASYQQVGEKRIANREMQALRSVSSGSLPGLE